MPKQSKHERRYGDTFREARRPPLHRDRVVEQAIVILDAEGPDALTFRRLAADLDVGVASLYWHVDNKEMLLQLAFDQVLGEIDYDADSLQPSAWDARLRDWLVELWRVMRRHPWAPGLAFVSIERGPNMLRHWDRGSTLLLDSGFTPEQVFYGITTLYMYVIGVGVQDAIWHFYDRDDDGQFREAALAQATEFFSSLDPETYPSLPRVLPVLAEHDEDEQFLAGAELLITGLRAQLGAG